MTASRATSRAPVSPPIEPEAPAYARGLRAAWEGRTSSQGQAPTTSVRAYAAVGAAGLWAVAAVVAREVDDGRERRRRCGSESLLGQWIRAFQLIEGD